MSVECEVWQREWDEAGLVSNKFHEILPKLSNKLLSFCNTRKENIVLNRLYIGHSYLTHSFILRKEEAPICVMCNTVLTNKLNVLTYWKSGTKNSNRSLCIHSIGTFYTSLYKCILQNMKHVKVMFV